jgi:glycosyltransferase involved in cell wall biosynthesis
MYSDSSRVAGDYDLAILTLFDPRITPGGAQQCAYDLYLNFKKYTNLRTCFIAATSPITKLSPKANTFIRRSSSDPDEFYFFTGEYDYFWHCCKDSRPPKDLTLFLEKLNPRSIFISHYMHLGIDLISMIRAVLPKSHISIGLHEMLFSCMADGQMVKKNNGQLCQKPDPQQCSLCFPEISADLFAARHKFNKEHLEQADNFIVPANHIGGVFSSEFNIDKNRIYVINHPIDLERYNYKPTYNFTASRPVRFGYFGQFLDNKGVDILLKAGETLDTLSPPRRFEIVINGGNKNFASEKYQALVTSLIENSQNWSQGSIVELGGYSHSELVSRMSNVDAVVVPSAWPEVFALVVTEAFACFKPVLAARIGGLAERLRDGVDGLNFEARNPRDLAQKMYKFTCMSDTDYQQMSNQAFVSARLLNPKLALQKYATAFSLNLKNSEQLTS